MPTRHAIVFIDTHDEKYPYNLQIIVNGVYTGFGRYCKNWYEVNQALALYNAELYDVRFKS